MKYLVYILFPLASISCTDLNESPKGQLTAENFYKTESDALAAVTSVYNASLNNGGLTMYNRMFHLGMEVMSDDAVAGPRMSNPDARAMASLTLATTNVRVEQLWEQHYSAINRANIAIGKIPSIDMDLSLKTQLVNEAKFLRGLLYFNLVRLWGEVPLLLEEVGSLQKEAILISRSPEEEIYNQVTQDLTDAENLPNSYTSVDAGRATAGAAKSLLAKVYLTRGEWGKAVEKSREVIQGPYGYGLFEDFADVFNVATKNGKEHIFSAQCESNVNGQGNRLASSCTPVGIPGVAAAGTDLPNEGVYELFSEEDKRKNVTFFTSLVSPTNGQTYTFEPRFYKYFDPDQIGNPTESAKNVPVIRFAEVLLIYAEALNEVNGPNEQAYWAINKIRERAGLALLTGLSKEEFREAVYLERRLELMMEFQRWFDLKRTGRLVEQLHAWNKPNAAEKHYLHPIPQREIDINSNLVQNSYWE